MATTLDAKYLRIPIESLPFGNVLKAPVYDDGTDVLLIAAGTKLTRQHEQSLRARGLAHVRIGTDDLRPRVATKRTTQTPRAPRDEGSSGRWSNGKPPFLRLNTKTASNPKTSPVAAKFTAQLSESVVRASDLFVSLQRGKTISGAEINQMIKECLSQISEDIDLFVSLGATPNSEQYPVSHSIQTARLSMAMGDVMGVDKTSLMDIGAGCMIHDVGMLRLVPDLLNSERPLDLIEKLDITKHPAYTFDMIKDVSELSVGTRMIAYQTHERLDGSGYPRKIRGQQIHVYSRIAMVADTFVAMTSPRPHRPAMLPHYAILEVLEEASAGRFDVDVVRGLLDTVSMFPLGSYVELNDGRVGTVLRANPGAYTKPVIEISRGRDIGENEIVDLKERHDLSVVRPLYDICLR